MQLAKAKIKDFAYGGQGRGQTENGEAILVWKALPGETVRAKIFGSRSGMLEAVSEEIITASPERIDPIEKHYFISSPWQILKYESELKYKVQIAREIFSNFTGKSFSDLKITDNGQIYEYRNSMEYGVELVSEKYQLTQLSRGRKRQEVVPGSRLAYPTVDKAAHDALNNLRMNNTIDAHHIHIRASRNGGALALVFNQDNRPVYNFGSEAIQETILGKKLYTGPNNFFQINPGCFEIAVNKIGYYLVGEEIIDYYGGVGTITIALSIKIKSSTIVESDAECVKFAQINIKENNLNNIKIIPSKAEYSLAQIAKNKTIILNPPREGLHKSIISELIKVKPRKIIYLSCKPITQARDIKPLLGYYDLEHIELFNFFPRTPHIESLVVMNKI